MTIDQLSRPPRRGRAAQRWRTALVPLALLAPLGLAACGGADSAASDSAASDRAASSGDTASSADMQAYTDCLAANGVELPSRPTDGSPPEAGGTPPSMPDQDAMASAQEACADLAPEGGFGSGGGAPGGGAPGGGADMAEYTSCLEDNGVTVPEPGQGQGGRRPRTARRTGRAPRPWTAGAPWAWTPRTRPSRRPSRPAHRFCPSARPNRAPMPRTPPSRVPDSHPILT